MRPHGLRGTDCGQHSAKALRRPGVGFSNSHLRLALETKLSVRKPEPSTILPSRNNHHNKKNHNHNHHNNHQNHHHNNHNNSNTLVIVVIILRRMTLKPFPCFSGDVASMMQAYCDARPLQQELAALYAIAQSVSSNAKVLHHSPSTWHRVRPPQYFN